MLRRGFRWAWVPERAPRDRYGTFSSVVLPGGPDLWAPGMATTTAAAEEKTYCVSELGGSLEGDEGGGIGFGLRCLLLLEQGGPQLIQLRQHKLRRPPSLPSDISNFGN